MLKFTLYLGLNDSQTKTQVMDTKEAVEIVKYLLIEEYSLPGATIQQASGIYKHDNGFIVSEETIVIILLGIERSVVENIARDLKVIFNQESILVETSLIDYNFI